jgi:ribosome recycling factor
MTKEILSSTEKEMQERVEYARKALATVRTGRASLSILDHVMVDYYGTQTPLNQVANLTVPEATLITAQPWDATSIPAIEKAIQIADLGLNPQNDGKLIRIPIPPLTEDRRKEFAKKVHHMGEEEKTHIRQARRDGNEQTKKLTKDKEISEDEEKRTMEQIQTLTDKYCGSVDELVKAKEKDLLAV